MAFLLSFLPFALLSMVQFSQSKLQPFCEPNTEKYVGPKLPKLPTAFTAQVEANVVNRNYSLLRTEYYDQTANKGALRSVKNGKSYYILYNYNEDEMMVIDEASKNCTLQEIQTMHGYPFFGLNGSTIESIADLFRFGSQFNETFIENATVRGIPCYHWQACINQKHYSFLMDYYFSTPGWSMPFGEVQIVSATANGTSDVADIHHSQHSLPGNSTRSFSYVYNVFSFKAGPPEASAFQVPKGVFCSGMKDRKMLPSLPSVFSLELESVHPRQKYVWHFKEYYDIDRKLVMYQFYDYRNKGYGDTRIIHDFNHGVLYNMSGFVCTDVTLLTPNNTVWDGTGTKDHHLRMKTFSESIYSRNKSALVYTGVANVRGIDANVWIIKKEAPHHHNNEITMEYYFAKPSWNIPAGSLSNQSQVLLRIDVYGRNGPYSMNVINYDGESVPLSVFSIAPCYVGNRYIISLRLLGDWKSMVYKQEMQFNIAARKSIAEAANVTSLRIDGLKNGQGEKVILLWFTLLGKPPITVPDAPVESDLKDAVESLKKKVMDGDLMIKWINPVTKAAMEVKADKYFDNSMTKPTKSPTGGRDGKRKKSKGVPGGAVAGVAVLMTAIGICIGLAIAHVIMKRRGTSLFQYQRQE